MKGWLPRTRAQSIALALGLAGLLGCALLGLRSEHQSLLSYLFAFLFFTGLSLGSLALLMVGAVTGGEWGHYVRVPLLAAARILPLQAVLVAPILATLPVLYSWARPGELAHDAMLRTQSWYLDPTFFVIRSGLYFVVWLALLVVVARWAGRPRRGTALTRVAAAGLIVYALSTLLASVDWAASLLPHWHSDIFGLMVAVGWMLIAQALATARALTLPRDALPPSKVRVDMGSLLLMFVLAWSYLAFMQYLTIWVADLPAETAWYVPRTLTSWRALAWFLIAFHFAVPFFVLLSHAAKRRRAWLGTIAVMLLVAGLADAFWLVVPTFRPLHFDLRWTDLLAVLGIGGLWWCAYLGQLRSVQASLAAVQAADGSLESAHG